MKPMQTGVMPTEYTSPWEQFEFKVAAEIGKLHGMRAAVEMWTAADITGGRMATRVSDRRPVVVWEGRIVWEGRPTLLSPAL